MPNKAVTQGSGDGHTGDAARVGREVFERVVVGSGDCVLRSVASRPEPPPKYANTARSGERGGVARQSGKIDERYAANTPSHRAWALGDLAVDADTLLGMLARGLSKISNRLAALAPEASPELGDAVGFAAVDLDRHTAIVEVLVMRQTLNSERDPHE